MKALQFFTPEYLEECKKMSPDEILSFVDNFRRLAVRDQVPQKKVKSKLISIKMPEDLLTEFRQRCDSEGVAYQSQIKSLMRDWLFK